MEARDDRRLHRSRGDRMLAGVAGGLGEYFGVDPIFFRLGFVLVTLAGGAGVLAYIVLAIVLPEEARENAQPGDMTGAYPSELGQEAQPQGDDARSFGRPAPTPEDATRRARQSQTAGAVILILGVVFLLSNLNVLWWVRWDLLWPLLLIGLGVAVLFGWGRR
ncbi:MAG: PspC domain-containing protein [Chloroflexota bacterium]